MTGLIVRIVLRYLSGALVLHGFIAQEDGNALVSDPELAQLLEVALGLGLGFLTEAWYMLARRFGWAK